MPAPSRTERLRMKSSAISVNKKNIGDKLDYLTSEEVGTPRNPPASVLGVV